MAQELSKKERRELRRQTKNEARTIDQKKRGHKKIIMIVFIAIAVVVFVYYGWTTAQKKAPAVGMNTENLTGLQRGDAPWTTGISGLRERLNVIGLPALQSEGTALHIHQHLDIFIDGKSIPIPADIGVNQSEGFISDIHTHDGAGIIHVESPIVQPFTLGQFFDIWGVAFAADRIGGYQNNGTKTLRIFIDGKQYSADPRQLVLKEKQEFVITYGTDKELPHPIPTSYAFPAGY